MVIGEKGKSQLQRDLRSLFVGTINDTAKSRITFALVWHGSSATPSSYSITLHIKMQDLAVCPLGSCHRRRAPEDRV